MKRDDLDALLEEKFAKLFGQMTTYFDTRLTAELDPLLAEVRELRTVMDGVAGRLHADEQERAVIVADQQRHRAWIGQVADSTGTKLVPAQE